jgi:hypothetical protein
MTSFYTSQSISAAICDVLAALKKTLPAPETLVITSFTGVQPRLIAIKHLH